jgi:hypothetical protein
MAILDAIDLKHGKTNTGLTVGTHWNPKKKSYF